MSCIAQTGSITSYQRKEYEIFFWKIDGLCNVIGKTSYSRYYESRTFSNRYFRDIRTSMRYYPNGVKDKSGFIGLCFSSPYEKETSCVYLTMGLKTQSGRIEKWFSSYIFFPMKNELGSTALIPISEFLRQKEELAPSDCLTFVAILSSDAVEIIRDVADRIETVDKKEEEEEEKKAGEKVLGDMAKLLATGDKSDATIVVEEAEFRVHSCILAARTPVFAALFEHDSIEKSTRKITITDCQPAIFEEFLNYIYTGSIQNLTSENSLGLYYVADKYLIKDLKEVCRKCIQDNLSSETFCEAVQLAQKCGDKYLLEFAFDYCAMNIRHIIKSAEWKEYAKDNPTDALEILNRAFGPLPL